MGTPTISASFIDVHDTAVAAQVAALTSAETARALAHSEQVHADLIAYADFIETTPGALGAGQSGGDEFRLLRKGDRHHPIYRSTDPFDSTTPKVSEPLIEFTNITDGNEWHYSRFTVPRLWFTDREVAKTQIVADANARLAQREADAAAAVHAQDERDRAAYERLRGRFATSEGTTP